MSSEVDVPQMRAALQKYAPDRVDELMQQYEDGILKPLSTLTDSIVLGKKRVEGALTQAEAVDYQRKYGRKSHANELAVLFDTGTEIAQKAGDLRYEIDEIFRKVTEGFDDNQAKIERANERIRPTLETLNIIDEQLRDGSIVDAGSLCQLVTDLAQKEKTPRQHTGGQGAAKAAGGDAD